MPEFADHDAVCMRLALQEALLGRGWVEPNPMVGAVVVRDGEIIASGHHARFGGPHAEVHALERSGEAARGATIYVSLEPCCHHGKTPPCTDAILRSGIRRVVAAMRDPFPRVAGGGIALLREAGITVEVGLLEADARKLNAPFLKRFATGLPYVIAKWAMTLDGKTATASGNSRWISGEASRAVVHARRGQLDGIVIGIGTALADDPALTVRPPGPRTPARIVLDCEGRLPVTSQLVRTAHEVPTSVVVNERAPAERRAELARLGCDVIVLSGSKRIGIQPLLQELGSRGMTNVMVEGGGDVLGSFLDEDQIDEFDVFIAPIIAGGAPNHVPVKGHGAELMASARRLESTEVTLVDGDTRIVGMVDRPWLQVETA